MVNLLTISCLLLTAVNGIVYIERVTSDFNAKIVDLKIIYAHNSNGDAEVNVTFVTNVTITKILVYARLAIPENKDDNKYRRELVRTVIDAEKIFKGAQTNFLVNVFYNCISRYVDFELKLPLVPVGTEKKLIQMFHNFIIHFTIRERTGSSMS